MLASLFELCDVGFVRDSSLSFFMIKKKAKNQVESKVLVEPFAVSI